MGLLEGFLGPRGISCISLLNIMSFVANIVFLTELFLKYLQYQIEFSYFYILSTHDH